MGGYVAPTSHWLLIHLVLYNVATIDPVLGTSLIAPNSQCLLECLVGYFYTVLGGWLSRFSFHHMNMWEFLVDQIHTITKKLKVIIKWFNKNSIYHQKNHKYCSTIPYQVQKNRIKASIIQLLTSPPLLDCNIRGVILVETILSKALPTSTDDLALIGRTYPYLDKWSTTQRI
jgi:hypothetical protein